MKCVTKPKEEEEAVYYSDFSGKLFRDFVPVTVTIECGYGSDYDGAKAEFHLSDKGLEQLILFMKDRLCEETKKEFKRRSEIKNDSALFYQKLL